MRDLVRNLEKIAVELEDDVPGPSSSEKEWAGFLMENYINGNFGDVKENLASMPPLKAAAVGILMGFSVDRGDADRLVAILGR